MYWREVGEPGADRVRRGLQRSRDTSGRRCFAGAVDLACSRQLAWDHMVAGTGTEGMALGRLSAFTTKATLEMLRRRAYSAAQFDHLATESPFHTCEITAEGIGLEVRLKKGKSE